MPTTSKNIYCSNSGNPYTISVTFSESGVKDANNTSVISISGYLVGNNINWSSNYLSYLKLYWYDNKSGKRHVVTSGGFYSTAINVKKTVSGSVTVTHNNDGSLSGYAILEYQAGSTSGGWAPGSNSVQNGNTILTTIARASGISALSGTNLGSAVTVTIDRKSSAFTHKVEYSFAGSPWTLTTSSAATSATFTPDIKFASYIPNSITGALTVRVTTLNGSTQIGSAVTKVINLTLPNTIVPTMGTPTATRVDNGVPSTWGVYVKNFSKTTIGIVSAAGSYGSTIKSYSITGPGLSVNSSSGTSDVLNSNGTLTYACTATDSRGRTVTKNISISVVDYVVPSMAVSAVRCDSSGVEAADGTYLRVTADYSIASVSGKNSVASKSVICNGVSNTEFGDAEPFTLAANASIGSTYVLTAKVTDALGKSAEASVTIPTSERIINIRSNKKGIAFGKFSEKDAFEVAMPAYFNTTLTAIEGINSNGPNYIGGISQMGTIYNNGTINSSGAISSDDRISAAGSFYDAYGTRVDNGLTSYTSSAIDPNTTTNHLILTHLNTPLPGNYYYITTDFFNSKSTAANCSQVATPYATSDTVWTRYRYSNVWSAWTTAAFPANSGNGWMAYKFNNGLLIQFKFVSKTFVQSAWGGVYSSDQTETSTYPITFADVPIRYCGHHGLGTMNFWGSVFSTPSTVNMKTTFGYYSIIRGSAFGNFTANIWLLAIGRWK